MKHRLPLILALAFAVPSAALAQNAQPPPPMAAVKPAMITKPPGAKPTVTIAVASVTLGDECSNDAPAPAVKTQSIPANTTASSRSAEDQVPNAAAGPANGLSRMQVCVQSAIVLKITSKSKSKQVIEIAKVELVDAQGNVLGSMTARNPTQWKAGKRNASYQPWDLSVARGKSVQARWWLSAPPVSAPSRANAVGGYRVNVTVVVDGQETSVSGKVNANEVRVISPPLGFDPPMAT
jgi:hypothetical protein